MKTSKTKNRMNIKSSWLLSAYAAIPLGVLFIVIDWLFLSKRLQESLPYDPNDFLLFTLVFTLPHIMASFFGFADKDYIHHYGKRLLYGAQAIAVAAIALPVISLDLTFLVFALLTMTHVFMQQSGVSKSLMRGVSKWHRIWQWLGVFISFTLYLVVYTDVRINDPRVIVALAVLAISYCATAIVSAHASRTVVGTYYFWATFLLPITGVAFILLGYPILAIAIPRIVHDATAFHFYIAHDSNRYADSGSNYIYGALEKLRIPIFIISPVLAVIVALPFQNTVNSSSLFSLSMFIFLYHYYIESFIWKRNSLHRRYATPV